MPPIDLYERLSEKGLSLATEDGRSISISPASLLTDQDRREIRRHKQALLDILACRRITATDVEGGIREVQARFRLGTEEITLYRYSPALCQVFQGMFALDTETEPIVEGSVPRLALATASNGTDHYVLHPDDLAAFVLSHSDQHIVFHNAAFDFWVVCEHLRRHNYAEAAMAWMQHLRHRRLHDTMLLDMLLRLGENFGASATISPRDLGVLAHKNLGIELDKDSPYRMRFGELIGGNWATLDQGFFEYAGPDSIATARLYRVLHARALQLMERHGFDPQAGAQFTIDPLAVEKFGVLTERIQAVASVALNVIGRTGMHADQTRLDRTAKHVYATVERQIRQIRRQYPGIFKLDSPGHLERAPKTGAPCKSDKALDEYLARAVAEIQTSTGKCTQLPRTPKGRIAKSLEAWEDLIPQHPFLQLWFEYGKGVKLYQFLKNLKVPVVRPHYNVLCRTGRTTCSSPNMQQVPRQDDFREVIVPSPGFLLLTIDYRFIELVTLAAVCRCRFALSTLAEVIEKGVDPHCYTAAMLLSVAYEDFLRLKETEPERFKRWRQMAKPINFGVPGGMGAKALVEYAARTYGVQLSLEEAEDFRRRLIEEVYPELKRYLRDTSLRALANNLAVTHAEVLAAFDVRPGQEGCTSGSIRKIVEGKPIRQDGIPYSEWFVERVWDALNELNRNPAFIGRLSLRIGSEELAGRLFSGTVATLTGRIRAGVGYTAERNSQFQGLAADGGKIALANLVAAGFRVVGFVHDEILIELEDRGGFVERKMVDAAVALVRAAMEEVTFRVPVGCEYSVATCWSKRAKIIEEGDQIKAWSPEQHG